MPRYEHETLTIDIDPVSNLGLIQLSRAKALNSFIPQQYLDLAAALAFCDAHDHVSVVVLTGSGKFFSSGHDLKSNQTTEVPPCARSRNRPPMCSWWTRSHLVLVVDTVPLYRLAGVQWCTSLPWKA